MDPEWTRIGWEETRTATDRLTSDDADRALEALRSVFPPDRVEALRAEHPVAAKQTFANGRLTLLELGHALAELGTESDVLRLRQPAEFESTMAELRAALMVSRAGAHISKPEQRFGAQEFDFTASFTGEKTLAVEVKTPRKGERTQKLELFEVRLLLDLMERLPLNPELQARATVTFSPEVEELVDVDLGLHLDAALAAASAPLATNPFQTFSLGPLGSLTVAADTTAQGLQFEASGVALDPQKEGRRFRRSSLTKASQQLAESDAPGVVIVDLALNSLLTNSSPFLQRWTDAQGHLAGTILMDRHFVAGRMYAEIEVLPGQHWKHLEPLCSAWELCDQGHLHYCAVCRLPPTCPVP